MSLLKLVYMICQKKWGGSTAESTAYLPVGAAKSYVGNLSHPNSVGLRGKSPLFLPAPLGKKVKVLDGDDFFFWLSRMIWSVDVVWIQWTLLRAITRFVLLHTFWRAPLSFLIILLTYPSTATPAFNFFLYFLPFFECVMCSHRRTDRPMTPTMKRRKGIYNQPSPCSLYFLLVLPSMSALQNLHQMKQTLAEMRWWRIYFFL